jgi:pyrophosphatase PpaX
MWDSMASLFDGRSVLLFDLDGTVLDTKDLILASYHFACEKVLGRRLPDEPLLDLVGVPLPEQMHRLVPEGYADAVVEAYREHNALGHDRYINYFEGTREALTELASRGWPMAIVTSKRNASAHQGLASFNLEGYFKAVIGYDDTDRHKPDPTPLLLAAERMGVEPVSCAYIGDSPYDMQAATAAGMLAIGATWGFFTSERLLGAGAQALVSSINGLPGMIGHPAR